MQDGDTVPISGNTTPQTGNMMLGRYRLLRRIGKGGMGEVWLGEDPRLRRQVAIKTLKAMRNIPAALSKKPGQRLPSIIHTSCLCTTMANR